MIAIEAILVICLILVICSVYLSGDEPICVTVDQNETEPQQFAPPKFAQSQQFAQPQFAQPQQFVQPQFAQPQQFSQPQQFAQPQFAQNYGQQQF